MSRKKARPISKVLFFSTAGVLMVGLVMMCLVQMTLFSVYFVRERRAALSAILDGANVVAQSMAEDGYPVIRPMNDKEGIAEATESFELFNTTAGALVFVTDSEGNILLHNGVDAYTGEKVPQTVLDLLDEGGDVFRTGTMGGVYTANYYTVGRQLKFGDQTGYLFAATPANALTSYVGNMMYMFTMSALLMLLVCGVVTLLITRRITRPIQEISEAARKLGSGDFTARAPIGESCDELDDFAITFNNMAGRLQTIDNARGQFMGNIAHELRTPMTTIKGFIDGMMDGTIPQEEHQKYLAVVSQETGRLARLVQNMLDITKLEAGEVPIHAKSYDIMQTIADVVLSDEQRIEDGKIDITGLEDFGRLDVYADPDFVHQVIYNIVDNAIKFTPAGGSIHFEGKKLGDMAEISIQNTGPGIAPEALPFVFERFYKEDKSRGMNTKGSGLGLHICKILINLSGGQIRVESKEGEWCRFVFTLPTSPAKPVKAQ